MKNRKTTAVSVLALVMLVILAACSAPSAPMDNTASMNSGGNTGGGSSGGGDRHISPEMYDESAAYDGGMGAALELAGAPDVQFTSAEQERLSDISLTDPDRKLIRRAYTTVETTEFDESVAKLEAMCLNFQGFTENSSVSGSSITERYKQYRTASYIFRIPSVRYNEFLNSVGTIGNLISKTQESQDVTDAYYDMESRLRILRMRQERLEKLLVSETESEAIVNFENSLSDTLYEIERMTGSLRRYDSLVEYSTINVYLREVEQYTEILPVTPAPQTVGGRIAESFGDSTDAIGRFFVNLTVFVLGNILYLIIWAVIITGAVMAARKLWKRQNEKRDVKRPGGGAE